MIGIFLVSITFIVYLIYKPIQNNNKKLWFKIKCLKHNQNIVKSLML